MIEKLNQTSNASEVERFRTELAKWKKQQYEGENVNDPNMVVNSVAHQIEYLNYLGQYDEARAFLDNLPSLIDMDQPYMREMIADVFVMMDDVDYFFDWYKQNLFSKEANEGDQILVYALLCNNRNREALEVFDKIFPALKSSNHFTHALRHIPKLIEDQNERETYYLTILEKSQNVVVDQSEPNTQNTWHEIALQVQYCLNDISGFEQTANAIAETDAEIAQPHLNFLERLQDKNNPKWREKKVFGIGLSKTGTSSLSNALALLNFSTAHWTHPYSHDLLKEEDIPLFDSLTDISISHQYKEIYSLYPDAKFVLSSRSVEAWEKSFLTHYKRSLHAASFVDLKEIITNQQPPRFGQEYVDMHQELYFQYPNLHEAYFAHEQDVLNFFKGKEGQLLVLDVSKSNALQDLSKFLEVDCPQNDFPHVNTKEEKTSWVSPISGVTRRFKSQT
jgi:hypothetical protein